MAMKVEPSWRLCGHDSAINQHTIDCGMRWVIPDPRLQAIADAWRWYEPEVRSAVRRAAPQLGIRLDAALTEENNDDN